MVMAKVQDIVVGACIFRSMERLTCPHELSLAMREADYECAHGEIGCHVCVKRWHKSYFRFAVTDAPSQCECAQRYW